MPSCDLCGGWEREVRDLDGVEACTRCATVENRRDAALAVGRSGEVAECAVCGRAIAREAADTDADGRPVHAGCVGHVSRSAFEAAASRARRLARLTGESQSRAL